MDHTGIDLIARRPKSDEVLGISVKSRSRHESNATEGINLLRGDDQKIEAACRAFHCVPYVAIIADVGPLVHGFLLPLEHARKLAPGGSWGMSLKKVLSYKADSRIDSFALEARHGDWVLLEGSSAPDRVTQAMDRTLAKIGEPPDHFSEVASRRALERSDQ